MLFPKYFNQKNFKNIKSFYLHYILVNNHIYNHLLMFDIFHHLNMDLIDIHQFEFHNKNP